MWLPIILTVIYAAMVFTALFFDYRTDKKIRECSRIALDPRTGKYYGDSKGEWVELPASNRWREDDK